MESQTAACETTGGHNLQCYQTVIHAVNPCTMKPPYTRTARNRIFFRCRQVPFPAGIWSLNPRDCKVFPWKNRSPLRAGSA